jgi:hypothetical protein
MFGMFRGLKNFVKEQLDPANGLVLRDKQSQNIRRRAVQQILFTDKDKRFVLKYHGQTFPAQINYLRKPVEFIDNETGQVTTEYKQVGVVVKAYIDHPEVGYERFVGWSKISPEDPVYDRDFGVLCAVSRLVPLDKYQQMVVEELVPEDVDRQMSRLLRLDD